jgi:hypothetical protein
MLILLFFSIMPALAYCQKDGTFRIGTFKLVISGKENENETATVDQLVKERALKLMSSYYDCKIVQFLAAAAHDGEAYFLQGYGNTFTKDMLDVIRGMKPGEHLVIQCVRILHPDGSMTDMPGKSIKII